MKRNFKTIELLAPAKNKECAIAAINTGADAIYIGPDSFGARKKAGNSIEDLKDIVNYAHKFLVKIYVTVNTILYDNELKNVEKLVWDLYKIGVDAVIFQDFSFFKMNLPPIALHASTQCNNDTLEKIKFLKNMNVQRVVLPREFSIDEINQVTQNIDIETEVFVHGALCVCYSGQCYFSNYIGGRSANRGECAQPCRKKYSLIDEKGNVLLKDKYLLSMKDNNLSKHLEQLVDANVTSLKIEGRLKDKEYVTNVVSFYRKELDKIIDVKSSKGLEFFEFEPNLKKTFNREYTNFYFDGKRKHFINPDTPKFRGEKVAKVASVKGNRVYLDKKSDLNISDKLSYFFGDELTGTTVTKIFNDSIEVLEAKKIKKGTILYRNYDSTFFDSLNKAAFVRKIPLFIEADNNKITLKSFNENEVQFTFDKNFEIAKDINKAKENFVKQFSKLGDTEFFVEDINISDDFNLFIPVSKLNDIRRNMISMLQELSLSNYEFQKRNPNDIKLLEYPIKTLDYSFNISNRLSKEFYEGCGCRVEDFAPEVNHPTKKTLTLMKTKHCLRDYLGICLKSAKDKKQLYLLDEFGKKYPLVFDCKNCIMKIEEPV